MTSTIRTGADAAEGFEDTAQSNVMDDMRSELRAKVVIEPLKLVVPCRPNFSMVYMPDVDLDRLKAWQKRSKESNRKDANIDMKKLAVIVLSQTCIGLEYKGKEQHDSKGQPLTFQNPELHEMLESTIGGVYQCVEKMYGLDGHMVIVCQAILSASGFDDYDMDSEGSDPLDG